MIPLLAGLEWSAAGAVEERARVSAIAGAQEVVGRAMISETARLRRPEHLKFRPFSSYDLTSFSLTSLNTHISMQHEPAPPGLDARGCDLVDLEPQLRVDKARTLARRHLGGGERRGVQYSAGDADGKWW